jgi:SAM-dependent methyltransferase
VSLAEKPRDWWENAAFEAGFRKHPSYYSVNPYVSLNHDGSTADIPLEKIPPEVLARHPLEELAGERDLHMDMSRETGPRSDAHMSRYHLAAEWVRPSDTVLDCACGLGYGTAMLACLSRGRNFIGVDLGNPAINYAQDIFGNACNIRYQCGDAQSLGFLADNSIDTLVSFETIEHLPDYEAFLSEARRVLRPDGRIITSVPNRWEDETGQDPNPYHFHVFDYEKLRLALQSRGFIIEARYSQTAPGGFKLSGSPRALDKIDLSIPAGQLPDTEWWIVIASVNPHEQPSRPWTHPDFDRSSTGKDFVLTDFATHYVNPWIYRPMVQMGERLGDKDALLDLARQTLTLSPEDSADAGAALTVIGYSLLDGADPASPEADEALNRNSGYLSIRTENPHVIRWQISLAYLSALLASARGDRSTARKFFAETTRFDPLVFSPLISTKIIAAWFWSGIFHLVDHQESSARNCFQAGIEAARRALHAPDGNAIGNPEDPLTFGFPELAEIADMASQCANALHHLEEFGRSPGKFWKSVDTRRFGLAGWARQLEKELSDMEKRIPSRQKLLDKYATLWHDGSRITRLINNVLARLLGVRIVRLKTLRKASPE